jgi:ABC-type glycerol-3-phosphate transport system substrate-binding protein
LRPEKALRFIAFLVGPEQQVQMALAANQPPALETAYGDKSLLAQRPDYEMLHKVFVGAGTRPSVPAYRQLSEAIYSEANRMLAGEQGLEATVANIQRRAEAILR